MLTDHKSDGEMYSFRGSNTTAEKRQHGAALDSAARDRSKASDTN